MAEQKIKVGYIIHNTEDDVHVLHGGIKKTLAGTYDGTPIETASSVDMSKFLSERKLPLRIDIKTQSKEVTAGTSRTTVTPDEGYVLSEVQIEPTPSEPKTVQAQPGEVLIVEPDDDTALLNRVTVHPVPLQHKEVTPTKSSQTIYPDTGKSFNAVSVKPIPDEYIIPTGNKQITGLGKVNVTAYAEAEIISEDLKPEYIKKDKNILGVIGTLSTIGGTSWDDIDLSNYIPGELYIFHAQNGIDMYIGNSVLNSGIYHINKQTGVFTQIHTLGYYWRYFFEDNKGNVYVSSGLSSGILHLSGTTVTQIYTAVSYWRYFFEDNKGNVYVSSSNYTGILHISGTTATKIYTSGIAWQYFFEDSKGNVYVSSSDSGDDSLGILHISDTTVTKIYTSEYNWKYFFEDSKGNVYVGSSGYSSTPGLLHISGTIATQIHTSGSFWRYFFEDSKGNVYVGSSYSSGILHLSGAVATQIYTLETSWQYFFEDSKGNVYVSGGSSKGLLHISDTTVTKIYTSGYSWQYFFEDSKGNVYVGSSYGNTLGLLHISGTTVTQIHTSGTQWQYFFEDSKGNIYVGSSTSAGILHLSSTSITKIHTARAECYCRFKETDYVYAYTDQYPTPDSSCLILDGTTVYSVPIYEELLLPSNAQRVTVVPSAETQKITPENNRTLVEVTVVGDENLKAENIKEGIILYEGTDNEIVGSLEVSSGVSWDDVNLTNYIPGQLFIFHAQNDIDMYIGSYAPDSGIYHINKQTGVLTQIYTTGNQWRYFFEDSKGNVYVSSSSDDTNGYGILHLSSTTVTQIYTTYKSWQYFFEDSKGNVYIGSGEYNKNTGILHLTGRTATQIYTQQSQWQYFFEDSKGNVYVGASNGYGVLHLSGSTVTQIYTTYTSWHYFFEDSKGNVYVGSNKSSTGILQLTSETATQIYTSGYRWQYFFEDSKGNVYVSSDLIAGVLHLSGSTVTQIYTTYNSWCYFFEDSKGNVYVGNNATGSIGLLYLSNTTATQIYSSGSQWQYFFEDSKGNVYVGSSYFSSILYLSDGTATQIHTSGSQWQYFFEDSKGNVYVSSNTSGILHLSGTTVTQIHRSGYNWQFKETDYVYAYTDQYPTSDSLYLKLDGTTVYSALIYEELLRPSKT